LTINWKAACLDSGMMEQEIQQKLDEGLSLEEIYKWWIDYDEE
jgi:hypothetical protein